MSTAPTSTISTRTVWPRLVELVRARLPAGEDLDLEDFLRRKGGALRYTLGTALAVLDPDTAPIRAQLRERLLEPHDDPEHFEHIIEIGRGFELDIEDFTECDDFARYVNAALQRLRGGSMLSEDPNAPNVKCLLATHPLGAVSLNQLLCRTETDDQHVFINSPRRMRSFLAARDGALIGWLHTRGAVHLSLTVHAPATLWWLGRHVFDDHFFGAGDFYKFPDDDRIADWIEQKTAPVIADPDYSTIGTQLREIFQLRAQEIGRMQRAVSRQKRWKSKNPLDQRWQRLAGMVATEAWGSSLRWADQRYSRTTRAQETPRARALGQATAQTLVRELNRIQRAANARADVVFYSVFLTPNPVHLLQAEKMRTALGNLSMSELSSTEWVYATIAPVRETMRSMQYLWDFRTLHSRE